MDFRQCKIVFKGDVFHAITVVFSINSQSNLKGKPSKLMPTIICCKDVKIKKFSQCGYYFRIKGSAPITAKQLKRLCADSLLGGSASGLKLTKPACYMHCKKGHF